MPGIFTVVDGVIAFYFLRFFPVRPLGWIIAVILLWRIWKDLTPPYDDITFNFGRKPPGARK